MIHHRMALLVLATLAALTAHRCHAQRQPPLPSTNIANLVFDPSGTQVSQDLPAKGVQQQQPLPPGVTQPPQPPTAQPQTSQPINAPTLLPAKQRRGLCWGFAKNESDVQGVADMQTMAPSSTWWYNWGASTSVVNQGTAQKLGIEFVPMQWGKWGIEELDAHISGLLVKPKYLLGFNEPNHKVEANLTPIEAAQLWPALQAVADKHGLMLGSPAAAPCGANCTEPDAFKWWDQFFAACTQCRVDFMAAHFYSCSVPATIAFLQKIRTRYGRLVWLTEFSCPQEFEQDTVKSMNYMRAMMDYMDNTDYVERYAWFALRTYTWWLGGANSLLANYSSTLTELGQLWTSHQARKYVDPLGALRSTVLPAVVDQPAATAVGFVGGDAQEGAEGARPTAAMESGLVRPDAATDQTATSASVRTAVGPAGDASRMLDNSSTEATRAFVDDYDLLCGQCIALNGGAVPAGSQNTVTCSDCGYHPHNSQVAAFG